MNRNHKKLFAQALVIFCALLCAGVAVAWSGPPGSPPTCPGTSTGCNAPINAGTGSETQTINGGTLTMTNSGAFGAVSITAGSGGFCLPGSNPTGGCITTWPTGGSSYFQASGGPDYNTFAGQSAGTTALLTFFNGVNTALGYGALQSATSTTGNTAIGVNALALAGDQTGTEGSDNTAVGLNSLSSNNAGINNVAVGQASLSTNTTGTWNVALGAAAGSNNTTGTNNLFLGPYAGYYNSAGAGGGNITGSDNIVIGAMENILPNQAGSNQLDIGNLIFGTGLSTLNTLSTGNIGIGTTSPGYTLTVNGTVAANAYYYNSDERLKQNIASIATSTALADILALEPVTFNWKNAAFGTSTQIGFIAQQVQSVVPEIVASDASTTLEAVDYARVTPLLVGAAQAQETKIDSLEAQVNSQQQEIDQLTTEVTALEAR